MRTRLETFGSVSIDLGFGELKNKLLSYIILVLFFSFQ